MSGAAEDKPWRNSRALLSTDTQQTHNTTHHSYKFKGHPAVFISFSLFPATCASSSLPAAGSLEQADHTVSELWVTPSPKGASRFEGRGTGEQNSVCFLFFSLLVLLKEGKVLQKSTLFISALSEMWKLSYSCLQAKSKSSHLVILSRRNESEWACFDSAAAVGTAVYSCPDQFYRKDAASLSRFKVQSLPLARGEEANSIVWGQGLLCVDSNKQLSRSLHGLVLMTNPNPYPYPCTLAS